MNDPRDAYLPDGGLQRATLPESDLLGGRYRVFDEWARGGMAKVFRGELVGAADFTRPVAIKKMLPALGDEPDFVRLFVEEARVVSVLSHPNIVEVLDLVVDDEGRFCIVMEWIDGVDLGTYRGLHARWKESPPWEEVARVGLHTARALEAAHGRPGGAIFHRDVTPSNVLLSTQGVAKLVDFGLARASDRVTLTSPGVVKGKMGYVAPELLAGTRPTAQTDLYALGVTLWEALAMRRLFEGRTTIEVLAEVGRGHVPDLRTLRPDAPEALAAIVHRLCAHDPAERYPMATELIADLAPLLEVSTAAFEASIRRASAARDALRG